MVVGAHGVYVDNEIRPDSLLCRKKDARVARCEDRVAKAPAAGLDAVEHDGAAPVARQLLPERIPLAGDVPAAKVHHRRELHLVADQGQWWHQEIALLVFGDCRFSTGRKIQRVNARAI